MNSHTDGGSRRGRGDKRRIYRSHRRRSWIVRRRGVGQMVEASPIQRRRDVDGKEEEEQKTEIPRQKRQQRRKTILSLQVAIMTEKDRRRQETNGELDEQDDALHCFFSR